jgi:hypothetical protein
MAATEWKGLNVGKGAPQRSAGSVQSAQKPRTRDVKTGQEDQRHHRWTA